MRSSVFCLITCIGLFLFIRCNPKSSANSEDELLEEQTRVKSELEKTFPMWLPIKEITRSTLINEMSKIEVESNILSSGLYGFEIGQPIGIYNDIEFRQVESKKYVHNYESNCDNCLQHEIKVLGDDTLRGIVITFYAPRNIVPLYQCPSEKKSENPNETLDRIFSCLPYLSSYAKENQTNFLREIDNIQQQSIWRFLVEGNWLAKTRTYNTTSPSYLIKSSSLLSNGFNNYSNNLSPIWIDEGIITAIRFCTSNYGAFQAIEEDYFQNINEYQTEISKYPVMTCLITSVKEVNEASFISLIKFLNYEDPLKKSELE